MPERGIYLSRQPYEQRLPDGGILRCGFAVLTFSIRWNHSGKNSAAPSLLFQMRCQHQPSKPEMVPGAGRIGTAGNHE